MNRVAVTTVFMASVAIGFAIWLVFDRWFVRPQNQLLNRLDRSEAIEASVVAAGGGVLARAVALTNNSFRAMFRGSGFTKTQRNLLLQLPDLVDLLAVALGSGEGLFTALARVSERATGTVGDDLKRIVIGVQLGGSLTDELQAWSLRANSRHIAELCTKLQLALVRGTPLAEMLTDQASSLRAEIQQVITKKAGQNETRMLVPLVFLILPITVMFAVYPSLQVLSITQ